MEGDDSTSISRSDMETGAAGAAADVIGTDMPDAQEVQDMEDTEAAMDFTITDDPNGGSDE